MIAIDIYIYYKDQLYIYIYMQQVYSIDSYSHSMDSKLTKKRPILLSI